LPAVAIDPPADLVLAPLEGQPRTLSEWLTNFNLAPVVIDPYTNQSAWILPTAARIMRALKQAGVRVGWLVTSDATDARLFLGPLATEFLTLVDPDRSAVRALGLTRLPAWVFILMDGTVDTSAEGWNPLEWREVARRIAQVTSWTPPMVPAAGDPPAFQGTDALA
jgi:hypothetical protein